MEEKTLLYWALSTAVIGIVILAFIPPTPPVEIRGEIAWTNGTLSRLIVIEEVWVEHEHTAIPSESCVLFAARPSFSGYSNARVLGVRPLYSERCQ